MNKLIKATICVGLGVAFLGGFSSEAKFSNVDSATIDFKNYDKDYKIWFNTDADEVYMYPNDGKLELRAKGKKTQVPTTLGEDTFRIRSYYDVNRDITLYVIDAGIKNGNRGTSTRTFIYRYNRQAKIWEKLVDSANYYSPYTVQNIYTRFAEDLGFKHADFMLIFSDMEHHKEEFWYPLDWNNSTGKIEYQAPRQVMIDYE